MFALFQHKDYSDLKRQIPYLGQLDQKLSDQQILGILWKVPYDNIYLQGQQNSRFLSLLVHNKFGLRLCWSTKNLVPITLVYNNFSQNFD